MRDELFKEWSIKNIKSIGEIPVSKKVWWHCEKGHEWEETTHNRLRKNVGCPYCSGRRAYFENCLQTLFPHLALEWHPTKNKELIPKNITAGTHKKVWWYCKKGHEWQASVVKRTKSNRGCPFCTNQKVCKDNSLEIISSLAKEWHPTKNGKLTPKDVVFGHCKKVWWLCNCGYSWEATPAKRSKKNTGCPLCKASRGEKFISMWLKYENIDFKNQYTFENCRNRLKLPFDFYIEKYNLCIEYQGEQHYHPIPYFGGIKKFEKLKLRDKIKLEFCNDNNIKLKIIPYWEYECLRSILKELFYE
jgi:hypothetical protein